MDTFPRSFIESHEVRGIRIRDCLFKACSCKVFFYMKKRLYKKIFDKSRSKVIPHFCFASNISMRKSWVSLLTSVTYSISTRRKEQNHPDFIQIDILCCTWWIGEPDTMREIMRYLSFDTLSHSFGQEFSLEYSMLWIYSDFDSSSLSYFFRY